MMVRQQADTMASTKHLAELRKGVAAWNRWRTANAEVVPDLRGAELRRVNLIDADLTRANLSHANLRTAHLNGAGLTASNLTEADLIEACLTGANLSWADLSRADLMGANFIEAGLGTANLSGANLSRASLRGANLFEANLTQADLTQADLTRADLTRADLTRAGLRGADLTQASVGYTTFGDNDLSHVKGLETVRHGGPSTIGVDTVYQSRGEIPEIFLRGAGVPDGFITYMKSLASNPVEFYSCFISYSAKDQDFGDRLYSDLQNDGVRCWFAPHDIHAGKKLIEQIDEAIRFHDKLLLILSQHSLESEWVKTEILKAGAREVREQRRLLFPIRLVPFETLRDWKCFDSDTGRDLAREIREYFIPDFSNWKNHDSYQEAFRDLLRDLQSQGSRPG
jgi:uncharacterized protein YjbI with pentapeptide repeats